MSMDDTTSTSQEQTDGLAEQVFRAISVRFEQRREDIARFTETQYSFEEWLNWEAFVACSEAGWTVVSRPSYRGLGVTDCKDFGDLLIHDGDSKVLVEIGLVHDGTGDKWQAKLDWDAEKLTRPLMGVLPLHIIVLTSAVNIESASNWQRWLGKVACWSRPTSLEMAISLPPKGMLFIRGWRGDLASEG